MTWAIKPGSGPKTRTRCSFVGTRPAQDRNCLHLKRYRSGGEIALFGSDRASPISDGGRIYSRSMRALRVLVVAAIYVQSIPRVYCEEQRIPVSITVVTVRGEGAINNVGQRSSTDPAVRIEDEDGKPVTGATVVFTLPTDGPSGAFGNGEKTLIGVTDGRGEAEAQGLRVNTAAGKLQVHVNASFRGRTARTNITQFNMEVPGRRAGGSSRTVLILLAIAGAAGGGAAFALSSKNGSAGTPSPGATPVPIGISAGAGTVGPPR